MTYTNLLARTILSRFKVNRRFYYSELRGALLEASYINLLMEREDERIIAHI